MTTKDKITKARVSLLLGQPFFGTLLLNLALVEDGHVGMMATDGVFLRYAPKFVDSLTGAMLEGVLAHEVLHCALGHIFRRGTRHPNGWNIACDYAINLILKEANIELPKGGLLDPKYARMGAEEIYAKLPQKPQDDGKGQKQKGPGGEAEGQGSSGDQDGDQEGAGRPQDFGKVEDAPTNDGKEGKDRKDANDSSLEDRWKTTVIQAAAAAKAAGLCPATVQRMVGEIINPPIHWASILREFIVAQAKDDWSWQRPNARYMDSGFMLPSLYSQRLGRIAIIHDTSGSIGEAELNQFYGKMEEIAHEMRPEKIVVISCDARAELVGEYEYSDTLPRKFIGGGGTDFRPALKLAEDADVLCAVYLTDLEGAFPESCRIPTIWVTNTRYKVAPFGVTIVMQGA